MILRDPKTEIRPSQSEESHDSTVVLSKAALNRYACPCPISFILGWEATWLGNGGFDPAHGFRSCFSDMGSPNVLDRIREFLDENRVEYRQLHHEPTITSEDSARVRGEDLRIGGKALLLKVGGSFRLFVLSAALRVDSQAIRTHFGVRKTRFANADELKELTGLVPGSVPPFGEPILPFDLYVDESIVANDRIAFNAGSLTDSVFMTVADYIRVAGATVFRFSLAADS